MPRSPSRREILGRLLQDEAQERRHSGLALVTRGETSFFSLVREHAIRAIDAWHLATAMLVSPSLREPVGPTGRIRTNQNDVKRRQRM
jgi:hypothetical protein